MAKERAPRSLSFESWLSPVRKPDLSRFLDPFDNRALLGYFYDVTKWHGYCRFLGLPQLRDNPDQPLQDLFVEPCVSRAPVHPDRPSSEWHEEVQPALQAVLENPRLVLLGDPGSGKSTLVSFIASQLSQPRPSRWQSALGPLVPLPIVLRELKLEGSLTGDLLLEAVLAHAVAEKLRSARDLLERLLDLGQGYFLLDGLDEIGNLETRKALRAAVFHLAERFPACRFLITSRVVGYEEVPFHRVEPEPKYFAGHLVPQVGRAWAEVRYVAPFSNEQIEQFARNWYARREVAEELRKAGASDLVAAVHGSESTLRLARIPNLLTLMALIHRIQRRLPHGRVLLFDKIAEAYLESIDVFRGIQEADYPLVQKRRWLAYIGFQMQLRRSGEEEREVLVDQATVEAWLIEAMAGSARGADPDAACAFLDYIGRRSGLLLPRGEGLFAFTHLSFQEYFAACYLADQVSSPRWLKGRAALGAGPDDLAEHAGRVEWRESLILLFELLADRPDWLEVLLETLFGSDLERLGLPQPGHSDYERGQLLAAISIDPYSGLSRRQRLDAWKACWRLQILVWQEQEEWIGSAMARRLAMAEQQDLPGIWRIFREALCEIQPEVLFLTGLSGPSAEEALRATEVLKNLLYLGLSGSEISDLQPLARHQRLKVLHLSGTNVADLKPLAGLRRLEYLAIEQTRVTPEEVRDLQRALPHLELFLEKHP